MTRRGVAVIVTLLAVAAAPRATAIMSSNDAAERAALPFRVFTDADGLPHNTVHAIRLDRSGVHWIATQDGAAAWDGRVWRAVDMPESAHSNFVRAILTHSDGSLWFGTQANGVHRLLDGAWTRVPKSGAGLLEEQTILSVEISDPTSNASRPKSKDESEDSDLALPRLVMKTAFGLTN